MFYVVERETQILRVPRCGSEDKLDTDADVKWLVAHLNRSELYSAATVDCKFDKR
jgi:hypothetical protein